MNTLNGCFHSEVRSILRSILSSELWRSIRRYKPERHTRPLQRRADSELDFLEPHNSRTRPVIDKIAAVIDQRPMQRTIVPDVIVWREASILSGILARLQGFDKDQRRRLMNDALLFVTARRHGCTLLTRNVSDFDLLQQLEPAGGGLFYRT